MLEAHLRDALLKLRDEVGKVLTNKANELKHQLARLEGETGNRGRHSSLKGRKVAVKYRDGSANAWAGRGAQPAGVVRKRLGLDLRSEKVDGDRTYRIVHSGGARSDSRRSHRRAA